MGQRTTRSNRRLLTWGTGAAVALMMGAALASPDARADETVGICPSGFSGVATTVTSCDFADNVRAVWAAQGGPSVVAVYSPVTGDIYRMYCDPTRLMRFNNGIVKNAVRCAGGNNAVVWVW